MPEFETLDSGERQEYASGMVRDTQEGKPRFGLLRPRGVPYEEQFLTRCAALMTRGIEKYGLRNWEKADSEEELERFKESARRHLEQALAGLTDEDHYAAVFFNLLAVVTVEWKLMQKALAPLDDMRQELEARVVINPVPRHHHEGTVDGDHWHYDAKSPGHLDMPPHRHWDGAIVAVTADDIINLQTNHPIV